MLAAVILFDPTSTWRLRARPDVSAECSIGAGCRGEAHPFIFVPWLFLTRQVRAGSTAVASFLVCCSFGFVISPRSSVYWWTKEACSTFSRVGTVVYITNQDLRVVLERFLHAPVFGPVPFLAIGFVGVCGIALGAVAFRRSSELLGVLVCATTGLIVSPVTWSHHLVWVVPVIVWLAAGKDRPKLGVVVAAISFVLFVVAPIYFVPHGRSLEFHLHGWQLVAGNSFFFAMAGFLPRNFGADRSPFELGESRQPTTRVAGARLFRRDDQSILPVLPVATRRLLGRPVRRHELRSERRVIDRPAPRRGEDVTDNATARGRFDDS